MAIIKGFAIAPLFTDNQSSVVSAIGELTNKEETFARDKKIYSSDGLTVDTHVFSVKSPEGVNVGITDTLGEDIARVPNFVIENAIANPGSYTQNALVSTLNDEFTASFSSFILGEPVSQGTVFVPSWIEFQTANTEHSIRIWFSRDAFASQYDEFEIFVIPRITNPANFNVPTLAELETIIAAEDDMSVPDRIADIVNQSPQTAITKNSFSWQDRVDPSKTKEVPFVSIIYGNGYSLDDIKQAIIDLLLDTTNGDDTVWRLIFPGLFGSNLYYIVPHWDKNSIPNASPESSFYSPVFVDGDNIEYAQISYGTLNTSHIAATAESSISTYRGLAFTIYPDVDNVAGAIKFTENYPDYINFSSQSMYFRNMSGKTQSFIRTLDKLLLSAETLGPNSKLEPGVSKRTEDSKDYAVASTEDGNTFMVLSRSDVVNR